MTVADELQKLEQLRQSGAISEEEFAKAKANLLAGSPTGGLGSFLGAGGDVEQQTRQWAMILHLSQLASFLVPLSGLVLPIVIWQIKKTDLPGIDAHGKIVVNWIISEFIYVLVSGLLCFVLIGVPMVFVVLALGIIFPIIGGVKANNGEVWKYPLSIPFFK
jgi:uncharacterized protein